MRTLNPSPYGAADLGECLATASKVEEGDFTSWYNEWQKIGERLRKDAGKCEDKGHRISAYFAYLRASNYYRTAIAYLYGAPVDDRLILSYDLHTQCFAKAMLLSSFQTNPLQIPFEGSFISALFCKIPKSVPSPTLIISGGPYATLQESFMLFGFAALQRGYNVLVFDGPGQGDALLRKKMTMRPDWEFVAYPIISYLLNQKGVDPKKIAMLGYGGGGYLVPRTATDEPRLAACAAVPGIYDLLDTFKRVPEQYLQQLRRGNETGDLEEFMTFLMRDKIENNRIKAEMWIHGADSPVSLLQKYTAYNLIDTAENIKCPMLIVDTENEPYTPGQAKKLYDKLTCPKDYVLLKEEDGGGNHCAEGALLQLQQKLFDWLGETLKKPLAHLEEVEEAMEDDTF